MWSYFLGAFTLVMAAVIIYSVIKAGSVAWLLIAIFPVIVLVSNGVGLMIKGDQLKAR